MADLTLAPDRAPARILIVDDHSNTAHMLARLLRQVGTPVEVLTASNGDEALALVGGGVEVLIVDFIMPGMNGLELIERLRGLPVRQPARIILVTAHHHPDLAANAQRIKIDDYLVKPVQPETIRDLVEQTLRRLDAAGASGAVEREAAPNEMTPGKTLDRAPDEMLAIAQHDLKNPIGSIMLHSSLLGRVGPLNARQADYVKRIRAAAEHMRDLVEMLLEPISIGWGEPARIEVLDLRELLIGAVDEFETQAAANHLQLRLLPFDGLPCVVGKGARLHEVLENLLSNAIKFTPSGGQITIAVDVQTDQVCLSVRDTGVGISPHDLPFVFEKNYRVRSSGALGCGGQGLGLAIVKSIVEEHGGQVAVESTPGEGSCFRITLPLAEISRPAAAAVLEPAIRYSEWTEFSLQPPSLADRLRRM